MSDANSRWMTIAAWGKGAELMANDSGDLAVRRRSGPPRRISEPPPVELLPLLELPPEILLSHGGEDDETRLMESIPWQKISAAVLEGRSDYWAYRFVTWQSKLPRHLQRRDVLERLALSSWTGQPTRHLARKVSRS